MRRSLYRQLKHDTNNIIDTFSVNPGKHVLSMGAGVQTTALLIKFGTKYDHVIFADTGDEQKETYYYIENYLKPFCKEHNISWLTARNKKYKSLSDYCITKKWTPNAGRLKHNRRCTKYFKISPILAGLKKLGATKDNPINCHIGISIDEAHRLNKNSWIDKPLYEHKVYPLIDAKLTRKDCYKIIEDAGLPPPIKSGCDFCPFNGSKKVRAIAHTDPERYKIILKIDQANKHSQYHLFSHALTLSHTLGEYTDDDDDTSCDSGHCFT